MTSLEAILGIKLFCPTRAPWGSVSSVGAHTRGWLDHCTKHHTGMETPLAACQCGARGAAFAKPDPKPTKVRRKSLF